MGVDIDDDRLSKQRSRKQVRSKSFFEKMAKKINGKSKNTRRSSSEGPLCSYAASLGQANHAGGGDTKDGKLIPVRNS